MVSATWATGRVVWREHLTHDVRTSKGFYGELFNWRFQDRMMGTRKYPVISVGGRDIGGLMDASYLSTRNMPNYWLSYVSVPNVDQVATNTSHAGGRVLQAPTDLPGIGRNAILVDPQGAIFAIMRADQGDAPVRETPDIGEFCWEQLRTPHPEAAASFYRAALGWHNMPAEGAPDEMMFLAGKEQAASAVKAPAGVPPNWLTYVVVQKAVDTAARAAKLGGQVLMGEVPVPNMGVMAIVSDPLGSVIGLFEPRNE